MLRPLNAVMCQAERFGDVDLGGGFHFPSCVSAAEAYERLREQARKLGGIVVERSPGNLVVTPADEAGFWDLSWHGRKLSIPRWQPETRTLGE